MTKRVFDPIYNFQNSSSIYQTILNTILVTVKVIYCLLKFIIFTILSFMIKCVGQFIFNKFKLKKEKVFFLMSMHNYFFTQS